MCHGTNPLVNLVNKTPVPNSVNFIKETPNICNEINQVCYLQSFKSILYI